MKQAGAETREKKIRWWINLLTLSRQVTEMRSEKTLEMNPDWGLGKTKVPVRLQGEELEA